MALPEQPISHIEQVLLDPAFPPQPYVSMRELAAATVLAKKSDSAHGTPVGKVVSKEVSSSTFV